MMENKEELYRQEREVWIAFDCFVPAREMTATCNLNVNYIIIDHEKFEDKLGHVSWVDSDSHHTSLKSKVIEAVRYE